MHRNGHQLISFTADAHFGARLSAFFYCTRFFLENNVPFDNTIANCLWLTFYWTIGAASGCSGCRCTPRAEKKNGGVIYRGKLQVHPQAEQEVKFAVVANIHRVS